MDLFQNLAKLKKEFPEIEGTSQNLQIFFNFPNENNLALKFVEKHFPFLKLKCVDKKNNTYTSQPLFRYETDILTPYLKNINEKYHPDKLTGFSPSRIEDIKFNNFTKIVNEQSFIFGVFKIENQSDVNYRVSQIEEFSYSSFLEQHNTIKNTYLESSFIDNLKINFTDRLSDFFNEDFIVSKDLPHTLEGFTPSNNVLQDISEIAINIAQKIYQDFADISVVYYFPYQPLKFTNKYLLKDSKQWLLDKCFQKAFGNYLFQHFNISVSSLNTMYFISMNLNKIKHFTIPDDVEIKDSVKIQKTQKFWEKYKLSQIKQELFIDSYDDYDEEENEYSEDEDSIYSIFSHIFQNEIANIVKLHFSYQNLENALKLAITENLPISSTPISEIDTQKKITELISKLGFTDNSSEAKDILSLLNDDDDDLDEIMDFITNHQSLQLSSKEYNDEDYDQEPDHN